MYINKLYRQWHIILVPNDESNDDGAILFSWYAPSPYMTSKVNNIILKIHNNDINHVILLWFYLLSVQFGSNTRGKIVLFSVPIKNTHAIYVIISMISQW